MARTNAERAKVGCKALAVESHLTKAAEEFVRGDLATYDRLSHETVDGVKLGTRITNAGYKWSAVGENAASGYKTGDSVVAAWMKSPGHRANILNCRYVHIGIGFAVSRKGTGYWVQDFGRPA